MSKAILVMDMPKNCSVCPMHEFTFDGDCVFAFYDEDDNYHLNCPLKEMPNKIDTQRQYEIDMVDGDFLADKICESIGEERQGNSTDIYLGWNACLNKIIGDEDETN